VKPSVARKLLRHRATGKWIAADGSLHADISFAVEVQSFTEAWKICSRFACRGVDLILKFENAADDVVLPLDTPEEKAGSG
jgi:hypothetical protein